jgi:hypothetical protein
VLFGLALDQWGAHAMGLTMGLGVLAVAALFALKLHARVSAAEATA